MVVSKLARGGCHAQVSGLVPVSGKLEVNILEARLEHAAVLRVDLNGQLPLLQT